MSAFEFLAVTDIGRVRKRNEDAYLIDRDLRLFAVADGMGGHQAGDVASRLALDTLRAALKEDVIGGAEDALKLAIRVANERVYEESVARGHIQGMGTTLTALWFPESRGQPRVIVGHVGDSRCYQLRGGELRQVTRDHSWVQAQIDDGVLRKEEAMLHPMRNVITRSIGFERDIDGDLYVVPTEPGDLFLLCSDGLSGKLTDADIAAALRSYRGGSLRPVLEGLVATANDRGGEDNITVVAVVAPA